MATGCQISFNSQMICGNPGLYYSKLIGDNIPVVPARGGAQVALDFTIRLFSSIELACAVRPPGVVVQACVRVCCCVVVQEHDLCAITLQCNAKRQCTFHSPHFTLHTSPHLISNHLISSHLMSPHLSSSHLIPSLLTCHLSKFFSTVFHLIRALKKVHLNSSHLCCAPERSHR